jgi:hypothetical protein
MHPSRVVVVVALGAALAAAPAASARTAARVARVAHVASARGGEAFIQVRAAAPGTDWGSVGAESAVLDVRVDGRPAGNLVLFAGDRSFTYDAAVGRLRPGRHRVELRFDRERSPAGVQRPRVEAVDVRFASDDEAQAARYAPLVVGRDLPEVPTKYENNHTDVPLLAYHQTTKDAQGRTVIEYTQVWSNEDGGTNTPALMARWGRTTDIEWIYRVTLGPDGRPVSEVYQAPNHATLPFTGAKVDDHPVLRTGTINNNMVQVDDLGSVDNLVFFPDAMATLPAGRARESIMDANPWSYQVMAKEMLREGKVEAVPSPATPEMSDQRDYLFAELKKATSYPAAPAEGTWVGTVLEVQRAGDPTWYASHHAVPEWSIQRDDPAATTVELPAGTTAGDIVAVRATAVPVGRAATATTPAAPPPSDYTISVTAINRGFMLDQTWTPGASFLEWHGQAVQLTPAQPSAVIWQR